MECDCSLRELVDMQLVLEECIRNVADAVRRSRESYHNQRVPYHCTFLCVDHRMWETGTFLTGCDGMLALRVLYIMHEMKSRSSRSLKGSLYYQYRMSCSSYSYCHAFASCTLQEQLLYRYDIHPVQEVVSHNAHAGHIFSQWILQQSAEDNAFTADVLFWRNCA